MGPRSALLVIATVIALVPPAGTVGFTDGRSAIPECRRVPLSSSAPYVARCQVLPSAARGARTESIVGSYSGSLQVAPSVSAPLTVLAATGDRPSG